ALEFINLLDAQFGDPQKEMTARLEMDKLRQDRTVGDYLVRFRAIALSTGYSEQDLIHRYVLGLKSRIRSACFNIRPSPTTFDEWAAIMGEFQAQFEIEASYRDDTRGKTTQNYVPPQKRTQG